MRQQRERRRDFRMRFMCLCSSQVSIRAIDELRGCSQEAGKTLLQRDLLDIHADLVPLAILDGGESAHPPAPPGAESKKVSPLTD